MSDSTDFTPLASNLSGDTLSSFGVVLSSDETLNEDDMSDGGSLMSEANLSQVNKVGDLT